MVESLMSENDLIKLPLGTTKFSKLRKLGCIYVDKSDLLYSLTRQVSTPVFFSRPRRFGKSLIVSALESLFTSGIQDFKDLAIEKLWNEDVSNYKVIHLDFSSFASKSAKEFKEGLTAQLANQFSYLKNIQAQDEKGEYFFPDYVISRAAGIADDMSVVLLIDEYDAPITHHLNDPKELEKIESIHSDFFASVKGAEGMFRFVFITGITRVSHVSLFSVFNNLQDITFDDEYSTLTGITEDELHKYFDPYVRNASSVLNMDVDAVYEKLKNSYDGFQFSLNAEQRVYNPWSVLSFLRNPAKGFQNYWYQSSGGIPTILVNYLQKPENLSKFTEITESENSFEVSRMMSKSDPKHIPVDLLLLQTGYFTLRKRNSKFGKLVLPNDEVSDSVISLSLDIHNHGITANTVDKLDCLAVMIDEKKIEDIANVFNFVLIDCVSAESKAFQDENTLRDIIYSQISDERIIKSREKTNAFGYTDLELKTAKTRLIIEFKRSYDGVSDNKAMQKAINQIKDRHYGESNDYRKLVRVAMVISTAAKRITKWELV